jgi:hypothetical protein
MYGLYMRYSHLRLPESNQCTYLRTTPVANLDYLIYPQLLELFIDSHGVILLWHARNSRKIEQGLYRMLHLPSTIISEAERGYNILPSLREGNPHQLRCIQLQCEYRAFSQCE